MHSRYDLLTFAKAWNLDNSIQSEWVLHSQSSQMLDRFFESLIFPDLYGSVEESPG